jgi:hypothetical protein
VANNNPNSRNAGFNPPRIFPVVISAIVVILAVAGIGFFLWYLMDNPINNQSLTTGVVIVLAVSLLLLLLFLVSVGYFFMQLTNSNEALGLPPGSIRAIIALLLILIWVIVSLFLFTGISQQTSTTTTVTSTIPLTPTPTPTLSGTTSITPTPTPSGETTTTTSTNGGGDAIKLAQQFYTTMSTLVVAIAAFYFGSNTFRAGVNAGGAGQQAPANPIVSNISPTSGPAIGGTGITITGTGFTGTTSVLFGSTADNNFTVNSDTQIMATSPAGSGTVDVTVTTLNGTSATSRSNQFNYT